MKSWRRKALTGRLERAAELLDWKKCRCVIMHAERGLHLPGLVWDGQSQDVCVFLCSTTRERGFEHLSDKSEWADIFIYLFIYLYCFVHIYVLPSMQIHLGMSCMEVSCTTEIRRRAV